MCRLTQHLLRPLVQTLATARAGFDCGGVDGSGYTKTMIFGAAKLVSYVSQFMTLYPGDITTPAPHLASASA